MNFETVIGLEVHVELKTNSKIFSSAPAHFGAEPNTNTTVVDLGMPGVLPVLNKRAVEYGMKAAMAINCEIAEHTKFDRKNYFYPDNPKAYQISQFDKPIGEHGWIEIEVGGKKKKIGITRLHLEEDAGKNTHTSHGYSLVDINRQGTPLIEIVSEPDIRSAEEAYAYLEKLKSIIQYTGVSDVKMEEGSMRCDANISIRPIGQEAFGVKTELKNLNSFNNVRKGIEYEEKRQAEVLLSGGIIEQETRRFEEATGKTSLMRIKEGSDDYRYFPEPDLVDLFIDDAWKERIRAEIPELPDKRQIRYINDLGLPAYDAMVLTLTKEMSDFFEATLAARADAKQASNWLMGEVSAYLNAEQKELNETGLTPENLAGMIKLIEAGTISSKIAKKVFRELAQNGGDAEQVVKDKGLVQISDEGALRTIIGEILDNNEQSITDYKNGKDRAVGFLVGQVMKATKGQANPPMVNKLLLEEMNKR
ncbi:Asp-tRNA(Asn)/Glu-tRNA(Gln) amidotransferase subunit GatB [Listeria welshimeri]|uniref:Aspartyl/glutamyl-tRNA(Asn/Gln) amidotransferase subunit B n=1 Tax=Listeria welshimeri serovar 6b (strain ATCC 35897 / DSM 20650 / CCUG 15529 / CIP 8149 / NCTC 11857 / SLCC 5334 / V8) TaxID=386043 RepID=GATB_LISW6|nr:Asp-tRNA(Asn)/Glu-tRNA(Gln) amidotransferase subunit GatB [Listeria welshimeri]A0AJK7.1 RecName: Full=Aspartyl/glutamyl-tRNA(Asn/Gln) amidotransferase subunit B; Short=Asp/Glu-ADT subunit B [Listeria welshimeri serovar 6b str. SLCC5334]MBC1645375.1 Asp-tRNA(Asn)/Glu-tRNA(Gln) amidotransferase subunit GatB [Listeria welshimeri]MBC1659405.1 Asp-tRNA(Asn)/Glu-tRNA(Gln) amidotransferase subunit GatB [Listeria welshimeri]MBC1667572.1 Asp-tRNA(Asn)/Glu-tRNA(Gln) amidotransferase subunit GatB [List